MYDLWQMIGVMAGGFMLGVYLVGIKLLMVQKERDYWYKTTRRLQEYIGSGSEIGNTKR